MNDLENLPPHKRPNQMRTCLNGVLTEEEAQARIGSKFRVLELRPAEGLANDNSNRRIPCTEVIFAYA